MSVFESIYRAGTEIARVPASGASAVLSAGREVERRARGGIASALDDALMATIDAVLTRLLAEDVVDRALTRIEDAEVAQRVTQRLLDNGIAEQIAERVLAGPEAERLLAVALRGPLVEEAVTQLLENQATWVLVDEIARSPSVTEAIAHQGTGFFDQVAERARDRSRHADTVVQRFAARLSRRGGDDADEQKSLPQGPP
jgi:hypothetical protein